MVVLQSVIHSHALFLSLPEDNLDLFYLSLRQERRFRICSVCKYSLLYLHEKLVAELNGYIDGRSPIGDPFPCIVPIFA
jgi:hypothetical protein